MTMTDHTAESPQGEPMTTDQTEGIDAAEIIDTWFQKGQRGKGTGKTS